MLKITTVHHGSETVLKLEGKLLEPWIEELCGACARAEVQAGHVSLDLSDIAYVDPGSARILRGLVRRGMSVIACSPFVAELLREPQAQL
jgi:hypothetical protein